MPPAEMHTPERVAEFARDTQVGAGTEAAVREALRHPTGAWRRTLFRLAGEGRVRVRSEPVSQISILSACIIRDY